MWIKKCQKSWELIEHKYIEALILIPPKWDLEFHVHIDASLLFVGALLAQNITRKSEQLILYEYRLLNSVE